MKSVSIIRDRGQLTIPDSIRKIAKWANPMSAVSISVASSNEIRIRPHEKPVDWDSLLDGIKRARSIHGSGKKSAIEFIQEDRLSH